MKAQAEEQGHLARKGVEYLQVEEYVSGIWELVNKNQKLFGNPPAGSNVMKLALDKLREVIEVESIRPSTGEDLEAFLAKGDLEQIKEYVLVSYQTLLEAIPECSTHGDLCVPNALAWVQRMKELHKDGFRMLISKKWLQGHCKGPPT